MQNVSSNTMSTNSSFENKTPHSSIQLLFLKEKKNGFNLFSNFFDLSHKFTVNHKSIFYFLNSYFVLATVFHSFKNNNFLLLMCVLNCFL